MSENRLFGGFWDNSDSLQAGSTGGVSKPAPVGAPAQAAKSAVYTELFLEGLDLTPRPACAEPVGHAGRGGSGWSLR